MNDELIKTRRARARELAAGYAERGDAFGWFDEFYKEAGGDNSQIPWADLEPNQFFWEWAERKHLNGDGRKALVVGCGLGDDAVYLDELGFVVTAFDISPTAIEWAQRLHKDRDIQFEVCDLFYPFRDWLGAFDFVLEIYTIQPLPLEMRPNVIDAIAAFVALNGEIVVVCRGREDYEEPEQLPWPLSRKDLLRFEESGLVQRDFEEVFEEEEGNRVRRFVVEYRRT